MGHLYKTTNTHYWGTQANTKALTLSYNIGLHTPMHTPHTRQEAPCGNQRTQMCINTQTSQTCPHTGLPALQKGVRVRIWNMHTQHMIMKTKGVGRRAGKGKGSEKYCINKCIRKEQNNSRTGDGNCALDADQKDCVHVLPTHTKWDACVTSFQKGCH